MQAEQADALAKKLFLASTKVKTTVGHLAKDPELDAREAMAVIRMFEQQASARVAELASNETVNSSDLIAELQDVIDGVIAVRVGEGAVFPDNDANSGSRSSRAGTAFMAVSGVPNIRENLDENDIIDTFLSSTGDSIFTGGATDVEPPPLSPYERSARKRRTLTGRQAGEVSRSPSSLVPRASCTSCEDCVPVSAITSSNNPSVIMTCSYTSIINGIHKLSCSYSTRSTGAWHGGSLIARKWVTSHSRMFCVSVK